MELTIFRQTCNELYTMGQLAVNDKRQTQTVEATECMLPAGKYQVRLTRLKNRRKEIAIFPLQTSGDPPSTLNHKPTTLVWTIGLAHSWIGSKKEHCICIGEFLIPGALYKGTEPYERLYDRIEKCVQRKEPITLEITERFMQPNQPIKHWTTVY